ncbi:hypothetical protein BOX15_Mlig005853g1 [Macrostomum lignano]|uniref:Pituitary tumor-transforming gene protein-binding factor n=2 Tax=Macrostomum lignano TaxID=282301 RepID=A0A1I8IDV0_9PLAT|nr:hypothetical protein BOX15_Mlig005853g1 [Macrostomum lignano]
MFRNCFLKGLIVLLCTLAVAYGQNSSECHTLSGTAKNENCNNCIRNTACMYCFTDHKCKPYPVGHLIPGPSDCPLADARWGTCFVNFLALIICMSILAFVILVIVPCCIYCCCCRKKSGPSRRALAESAKYEQERTEREARHAERRNDREKKYDEIRAKYGLATHGSRPESGYREFDNA